MQSFYTYTGMHQPDTPSTALRVHDCRMLSNPLTPNDLIGGGITRHVTHSPYFDFAQYRYFDFAQYRYFDFAQYRYFDFAQYRYFDFARYRYFDFARYRYFDLPQYKYSHVSVSDAPRGHLTDIAVPIQTINA